MENDGKKSGEDYQRQLLRVCSSQPANFIGGLLQKSAVSQRVGSVIGVVDGKSEVADPVLKGQQYFDRLYAEFFCSGKYELPETLAELREFRDKRVKWIRSENIKSEADLLELGGDESEEKYMTLISEDQPFFDYNDWANFVVPVNLSTNICIIKNEPISKPWGIIGLTYGLTLMHLGLNPSSTTSDDGGFDTLCYAVQNQLMAAQILTNGAYWTLIDSILERNKVTRLVELFDVISQGMISRRMVRVIDKAFKDSPAMGKGEASMRENFVLESLVVGAARRESRKYNNGEGENDLILKGLEILQRSSE